ncbi:MAG TPA: lipopolysaccharide heptosyltransferase II [Dongiaceae bacterium]|nr:lipopolysaccharide heptosyltransferase II [Dongiaceae bacterium]
MKILILKPSSLGDVIQALPVLRLLKLAHPASEIHWWIDSRLAGLLTGDPDLAQVVPFERHGWNKPARWRQLGRDIRWLRAQKYDLVIDLQCLARSGTFAWLANGQFLVGLDEPREGARGYYDRIVRRPSFHTHAVDWYLGVLPLLGVPVHGNFTWLPERVAVAQGLRDKWQMDRSRWIVLQPGARWLNKRWPVQHFAALVTQLALRLPEHRFAILGGGDDREMGETIAAVAPARCLNLAGRLSLHEMVEWLRASELMVTNDTGPMHVAAALGKPVVALFGPTEPHRTGPYGQVAEALRQPLSCVPCLKATCHHVPRMECLETITPARVAAEVLRRLGGKG